MDYRLKSIYEQMLVNPASVPCSASKNLNEAYKKVVIKSTVDFTEDILILESLLDAEENFIEEACIGKSTDSSQYFPGINNLLNKSAPLPTGAKGDEGDLIPHPGQQVSSITDVIKGTINGEETSVAVAKLFKSPEIKGNMFPNKGDLTEGLLAAAVFARLVKQSNINESDIFRILSEISNTPNQELTKHVEETHEITDTFILKIKLNPFPSEFIFGTNKEHQAIKSTMPGIISSIIDYTNDAARSYAKHFQMNGRPDIVSVDADGITNQKGTKVDVVLHYKNRPSKDASGQPTTEDYILRHFNLSVKASSTKQIGQVGGGGKKDSMETKFNILEEMWNRFGISIQDCKQDFLNNSSTEDAYELAYIEAAKKLKLELEQASVDQEKKFIKSVIKAIYYFATLDDPRIKLVQFTHKGYYVLNFKKLDFLLNSNNGIDLDVKIAKGDNKRPTVVIYDKTTNEAFLSIRMKLEPSTGYIRNYIQKEPLLVKITKVRPFE